MASIKISQLNMLDTVTSDDFFPMVDSGSLTTYHISADAVRGYIADSGSVVSASWASQSLYANYASSSQWSVSASYASSSNVATSASWASASLTTVSSSYAVSSSAAILAYWASASISASYSITASHTAGTASYAITASHTVGTASYALTAGTIAGTVPIGTILDYAAASLPDSNWLICTGSDVSRTTYSELFAVIGETWGAGDTTTTFGLPDLRRRMTVGMKLAKEDNSFISNSVGDLGGGEALNYHYHLYGYSTQDNSNNDFVVVTIGRTKISSSCFPPRSSGVGAANRTPLWNYYGDGSPTPEPSVRGAGGNIANGTNLFPWWVGTSFGIADPLNWNNGYSSWTVASDIATQQHLLKRQDLNMPYAVTQKIIRAR